MNPSSIARPKQASPSDTGRPGSTHPVSAESARAELEKILASTVFIRSPRLSRFLRFTVEHAVEGRADSIKEYVLGVEVFERGESYDPHVDPIVRVEAGRLRSKLKQYYENEGRDDPIIIHYPKGCYVPVFQKRPVSPPQQLHSSVRAWLPRDHITLVLLTILLLACLATLCVVVFSRRPLLQPGKFEAGGTPRTDAGQAKSLAGLSSIAVLPFKDISPQKDQESFCDGMTEAVITALTKVEGLHIAAPASVFAFKAKDLDTRKIEEDLRVGAALEGTVQQAGERVRVTARLTRVADGSNLWSEIYERHAPIQDRKRHGTAQPYDDLFAIQDEISQAIVSSLRNLLTGADRVGKQAPRNDPRNIVVLDSDLREGAGGNDHTVARARKSMQYFEQAMSDGPNSALAYTALAHSYSLLSTWNYMRPGEAMPIAEAAAIKALEQDSGLAAAHAALGFVRSVYDWDWLGAEHEYRYAIELDPNSPFAHRWYALTCLASMGRLDEALLEIKRASDLDPGSVVISCTRAGILLRSGQHDQAMERYHQILALNPKYCWAYRDLGVTLEKKSLLPEAITALQKAKSLSAGDPAIIAALGHAYGLSGNRREAFKLIDNLKMLSKRSYVPPYHIAAIYAGLGEKDQAFDWLEKAYEDHSAWLNGVKVDPLFSDLRAEPRFLALLKKMGLED